MWFFSSDFVYLASLLNSAGYRRTCIDMKEFVQETRPRLINNVVLVKVADNLINDVDMIPT